MVAVPLAARWTVTFPLEATVATASLSERHCTNLQVAEGGETVEESWRVLVALVPVAV